MTVTVVLHFSLLDLKLQVLANRGTTTKDGDGRGGDLLDFYSSNPGVSMLQYPASAGNAPGGERAREREREGLVLLYGDLQSPSPSSES